LAGKFGGAALQGEDRALRPMAARGVVVSRLRRAAVILEDRYAPGCSVNPVDV